MAIQSLNHHRQRSHTVVLRKNDVKKARWEHFKSVLKSIPYLLLYFVGGGYYFGHHLKIEWWQTVYYGVVTATTVGYGDYGPNMNDLADSGLLLFTMLYIAIGVVFVGAFVINEGTVFIRIVQDQVLNLVDDDPDDDKAPHKAKMAISVAFFLLVPILGSFVFWSLEEKWSYIDALYWSFVTATTVGYGDLSVENENTNIFNIFYILTATSTVAFGLGNVVEVFADIKAEKEKEEMANNPMSLEAILAMDESSDGRVDPGEYLAFRLVSTSECSQKDIDPILELFNSLDKDKSGSLDHDDLKQLMAKQQELKQQLERGRSNTAAGGLQRFFSGQTKNSSDASGTGVGFEMPALNQ